METGGIFTPPDEAMLEAIRKELKEDPDRFKKQIELFKEWLRCEPHLPHSIDEHIVENFIRQCKCNLEKAKKKFEQYLMSRQRLNVFFDNRNLDDVYFDKFMLHRTLLSSPGYTPEGYRLGILTLPKDINKFDFPRLFQYALLWFDFVLSEDTASGYIGICDFKNLSPQHLGKINIKLLLEAIQLLFNAAPYRIAGLHFTNIPHIPEALIALVKKVVNEKLLSRVFGHKDPKELVKHFPPELLPEDFGGTQKSLDELAVNIKKTFIRNQEKLEGKVGNLVLKGPVPNHKKEVYSFEDFEMGGSFRKLVID